MVSIMKESDLNRLVRKIIKEQENSDNKVELKSTKPLTSSEYQKKVAEIVYTCKKNPQTCSNTVSMMMNNLPPTDKQNIETEINKLKSS